MSLESAISSMQSAKNAPRWTVLRLETVTGVNAGWWVMAIVSSLVGALMAVLCVTMVHVYLKDGESSMTVEIEEEEDKQGVQECA